jgi:hypothetical protein
MIPLLLKTEATAKAKANEAGKSKPADWSVFSRVAAAMSIELPTNRKKV